MYFFGLLEFIFGIVVIIGENYKDVYVGYVLIEERFFVVINIVLK